MEEVVDGLIEDFKLNIIFNLDGKTIHNFKGVGELYDVYEDEEYEDELDYECSWWVPDDETTERINKFLESKNLIDTEGSETNINNWGNDDYYEIFVKEKND